jgi:hypothetical protein
MNRLMTLSFIIGSFLLSSPRAVAVAPALFSVFDQFSGPIIDSNFGRGPNWTSGISGLTPHSGSHFFESDNGNFCCNFDDLRLAMLLGGVIENKVYEVSFYIAANDLGQGLLALDLADFDSLAIGGANGTMEWFSSPKPIPGDEWFKWTGLYTPSPADIGDPFQFRMVVDIHARHSLALDGPITAIAIPEPAGISILISLASLVACRRGVR